MANDGGPAFPTLKSLHGYTDRDGQCFSAESASGLSLRDWFAGQALAGCNWAKIDSAESTLFEDLVARMCYGIADAMLAKRREATSGL